MVAVASHVRLSAVTLCPGLPNTKSISPPTCLRGVRGAHAVDVRSGIGKTLPCSKVTTEKLEKCCRAKRVLTSLTFKPSLISAVGRGASAPHYFKLPTKARSRLSRRAFEVSDCWTSAWPLTGSASLWCGVKMLSMRPRVPWKTRESLPEHHHSPFAVWDGRLSFWKTPSESSETVEKREIPPPLRLAYAEIPDCPSSFSPTYFVLFSLLIE